MILLDRMEGILKKVVYAVIFMVFVVFNHAYGYSDIYKEYWAYEPIKELTSKGVVSGYPDGSFKPNDNISRAEFLSILINILGLNVDVSCVTEYWADGVINQAKEKGIVIESEYSNFEPDKPITRREICLMIYRSYKEFKNINIDKLENQKKFLDISENKDEERIIAILSHLNVLSGYPDGTVRLSSFSSRGETCCFINNLLKSRCMLLSILADNEKILYEDDVAIIDYSKLPYSLKKWKYSKDIPYITTTIKDITIFPFNNPHERYKDLFEKINTSEAPYLKYRKKFGENNYVVAIEFDTTNNTESGEIYTGSGFLHVNFLGQEISIIDIFDIDEINRQLNKNGEVGQIVLPNETQGTSAFYVLDSLPEDKIRLDRFVLGLYDTDKNEMLDINSYHSLIVKMKEGE